MTNDLKLILGHGFREAARAGVGPMDALHLAAAHLLKADEFITTEKPNKSIHRTSLVKIVSLFSYLAYPVVSADPNIWCFAAKVTNGCPKSRHNRSRIGLGFVRPCSAELWLRPMFRSFAVRQAHSGAECGHRGAVADHNIWWFAETTG